MQRKTNTLDRSIRAGLAVLISMIVLSLVLSSASFVTVGSYVPLPARQSDPLPKNENAFRPREVGYYSAEVPGAWFDLLYELVQAERVSPPVAARTFGYAGVALYEALVPGMPGYQSLAGQLNQLPPTPDAVGPAYHWPTVANAALSAVVAELFAGNSEATHEAIASLEQAFAVRFQAELPPGVFARSVSHGFEVGGAIARWADADGYDVLNNCNYDPPVGPGLWAPTAPGYASALQPCWGQLRPFVAASTTGCVVDPPPSYSEQPASLFYQEAWEVYDTVENLTPEQLTIAQYWADNPGETGTPPGHSLSILGQVIEQQGYGLDLAAEAYARTGIAVADSFIACWRSKYTYNLVRPITYIHQQIDASWNPAVVTPPFPEYTSGHSVQSAAVARVLTDLLGDVPFTDHTHDGRGFAPRSFSTFFEFADEAVSSRLYGGIHFRSAIERGLEQGDCVGRKVSGLQFRIED